MNQELSEDLLIKLSEHLAQHMGINFATNRLGDLKSKMVALAEAFAVEDLDELYNWLLADRLTREQIELLADYLTVGETYFFRDPRAFAVLEEEILPKIIESRQQSRFLRIWSAACCTGEEPYSIAMIVRKLLPDIGSWQVKILATDINQTFIERAEEGIYGDWSFRATPEPLRGQFFKPKKNNRFQIDSQIRKMVQFEWMNLAEFDLYSDPSFGGMDIIFCRNVLIYFSTEHAKKIISSLNKCLIPDGYLFVSPNELPVAADASLRTMHRAGAIILQRSQNFNDDAPPQAVHDYDSMVIESPKSLPAFEEAQSKYDSGDYAQAVELLLERCQSSGGFSSLLLLTRSYANLGDLKNALRWCDAAIKANRLNAAAHYLRSTILQELDATSEAIYSLRQALLMDSSFVVAHFNLGILLDSAGHSKESQRHFDNVLKLLGNYSDNEILPESEGTTASGMRVIVSSLIGD